MTAGIQEFTHGTAPSAPGSGLTDLFSTSAGLQQVVGTGSAVALIGGTARYGATPADPTGTTDTTGKMMGLAGSIIPAFTGSVVVIVTGNLTNSTATAGDGAAAQITYGTGGAPANAGALTGTAVGNIVTSVLERATASDLQGFACVALVTGLTVGTTYWLDLRLKAIVGGTGQAKNLSILAFEI